MNISKLSQKPVTRLPVNRILFRTEELQKRFTIQVYHVALSFILGSWIIDGIHSINHELVLDGGFWFRQAVALLIIAHAILIYFKQYSVVLLSLATILSINIYFLAFFTRFFPSQNFSALAVIPAAFVITFYERRLSTWFLAVSISMVVIGLLIMSDGGQFWNAVLILLIFILFSVVVYLQSPSIKLMQKIHEVHEAQYVNMLKLVYDGVAVCQDERLLDTDEGFNKLFQMPAERLANLFLKDILAPEAYQFVHEALYQQPTAILHTLGKKFDGSIIPIELYMVRQMVDQSAFMILTFHDSSGQLGAEYALRRKNDELVMINRISNMVNSSLSMGEVLSIILEECQNVFHTRSSSLWLLEENSTEFVCVNAKGVTAADKIGIKIDAHSGIFNQAMQKLEPIFIDDVAHHPLHALVKRIDYGINVATVLVLPIIFQGKLIGMLQFLDDREKMLLEEDMEVLLSIAANSAIAINNARQFERMASDQQRWKIMQLISQRINTSLQPAEIYKAISENIQNILPFDCLMIALINENTNDYEIVHKAGRYVNQEKFDQVFFEKLSLHGIQEGKSWINNEYLEEQNSDEKLASGREKTLILQSVITVPMMHQKRPSGVLCVKCYRSNQYQVADVQMLELLAMHIVIALENARHYQEALESARMRDTIYLVGQEINARLNPDQVYDAIFRAVEKVIPLNFMFISSVDSELGQHTIRYFKGDNANQHPTSLPIDKGLSGHVIRTGKSYRTGDYTKESPEDFEFLNYVSGKENYHSLIFVPMLRNQQVTGILSVQSKSVDQYTAYHQAILELIAPYAATALENASLFSKIENQAITDELSTVYNRHFFNQTMKSEVERSQRYHRPLSLIILDIDNFKNINDHYGHIWGDAVIRRLGSLLKKNVRESDILARFGGDEFAIIMPETNIEQAQIVTEKLEELIRNEKITVDQTEIFVTASIGLAEMVHKIDKKAEDLIYKADYAMYHAKRSGRDRTFVYSLFDPTLVE